MANDGTTFGYIHVVPKNAFFDRTAVKERANKMKFNAMKRFGAYVRRAAQYSLRYAKPGVHSEPGKPPKVHTTANFTRVKVNKRTGKSIRKAVSPLRELIFFAYDRVRDSVLVGPVGFKTKNREPATQVLEKGGTILVTRRRGFRLGRRVPAVRTPMTLKPRPYMMPAAIAGVSKFPELFRGGFGR